MKFAINIPNYSHFSNPDNIVSFAKEVEASGWDGLFIWDHLQLYPKYFRGMNFIDPYVAMTLIAYESSKLILGPYITPLSRRRPWQVYRQLVSIDHISKGRAMLGVGLGTPAEFDFAAFGDADVNKIRAELLDEGLEIIHLLSSGEEISYQGKHYQLSKVQLLPKPYNGFIPIYIAGQWPNKPPFRRGARYNGILPISNNWPETLSPDEIATISEYITQFRDSTQPFEVFAGGTSVGKSRDERRELIEAYAKAGATWWCEDMDTWGFEFAELLDRVREGPPLP